MDQRMVPDARHEADQSMHTATNLCDWDVCDDDQADTDLPFDYLLNGKGVSGKTTLC